MNNTAITTLNDEDLGRYRMMTARDRAIEKVPAMYNRAEVEAHYLAKMRMMEDFARAHELDDTRDWEVSAWTGAMYYCD